MYFRGTKKSNNDVSLNDSIGYDKEGNEINLIDVIKDTSPDITDTVHEQEMLEKLSKNLKVLSSREKEIIEKRYGLNNTKELTQKEIAKSMHISRSYVSRIEKRALIKILKEFIKDK